MLKNAYLLAKIDADKAENERTFAEKLPTIGNYPTWPWTKRRPPPQYIELCRKHAPAFATVQEITTERCYLRNKRIYMNLHRNPQAKVSFFIRKVNEIQP